MNIINNSKYLVNISNDNYIEFNTIREAVERCVELQLLGNSNISLYEFIPEDESYITYELNRNILGELLRLLLIHPTKLSDDEFKPVFIKKIKKYFM